MRTYILILCGLFSFSLHAGNITYRKALPKEIDEIVEVFKVSCLSREDMPEEGEEWQGILLEIPEFKKELAYHMKHGLMSVTVALDGKRIVAMMRHRQPFDENKAKVLCTKDKSLEEKVDNLKPLTPKEKNSLLACQDVDKVYVDALYVLPDYKGRGIGSYLLSNLYKDYPKTVKVCQLDVATGNHKARGFYEHLGFEKIKEEEGMFLMQVPLSKLKDVAKTATSKKKH